jgi:hypothetical protein
MKRLISFAVPAVLVVCLATSQAARAEEGVPDYSVAERLLLMSDQMSGLAPATHLDYRYTGRSAQEPAFDDKVRLELVRHGDGSCCSATAHFLSGARQLTLPDIEQAKGNPVILYFLERDIREMNRLTKGSTNYFRKRIRMALYESAQVRDVSVRYHGKTTAAREITLQPYLNDPNQARFAQYTAKRYQFVLSDAVPGRVVSLHTQVAQADGKAFIDEEMVLDGADPLPLGPLAQR